MGYENPEPRIQEAIQSAVKWFDDAKLKGIRIERRKLEKPYRVSQRIVTVDVVEVKDPTAPPIWARFYDLEEMRPLFVQRTGEILERFDQIVQERRDGYDWYRLLAGRDAQGEISGLAEEMGARPQCPGDVNPAWIAPGSFHLHRVPLSSMKTPYCRSAKLPDSGLAIMWGSH